VQRVQTFKPFNRYAAFKPYRSKPFLRSGGSRRGRRRSDVQGSKVQGQIRTLRSNRSSRSTASLRSSRYRLGFVQWFIAQGQIRATREGEMIEKAGRFRQWLKR